MKRRILALSAALLFSACGGGSSSNSNIPSQGGAIRQTSTQRMLGAVSLQTVQSFGMSDSFGASLLQSFVKRGEVKRLASHWRTGMRRTFSHRAANAVTYGPCTNGVESATVVVSPTETQLYVLTFYDAACATLFQDIFVDIAANGSQSAVGTGYATQYTTTHDVFAYDTFALTAVVGVDASQFSIQITNGPDSVSPPNATIGIACASNGLQPQACGVGVIQNAAPLSKDLGVTMNLTENVSATSPAVAFNGNGTAYSAALNSLVLGQGTFPAWTITGGTQTGTFAINGSISPQGQGSILSGTLTVVDSAVSGTVNLTVGPSGVNGAIGQTGNATPVATFTTDLYGNGTITYSNGTTAQIVDWIIVG